MSLHSSDNVARFKAAEKTKRFGRRGAILGLGLAVFAASGVAYAAMLIFGSGQATANKYEAKPLTITAESFSDELYPGSTPDLTFTVKNDNPFPVKITKLELDGNPNQAVSTTCNWAHITTTLPVSGTAYNVPANQQVEVAKNGGTATVTLADAIKLNPVATEGCKLTVKFKVTGTQSGN